MIWSDHVIAQCKRLYIVEGRSASETARALGGGCTRNAVVGKAHRMGWLKESRQAAAKPAKAPAATRSHVRPPRPGPQNRPAVVFGLLSQSASSATARVREERAAEGREIIARAANTTVESPNARPFLEARAGCKWPIGEGLSMLSCCNPVERGSYCEAHADIAFNGRPEDRRYKGRNRNTHSAIELAAVRLTRFDRVDEVTKTGTGTTRKKPDSIWDEGRATA